LAFEGGGPMDRAEIARHGHQVSKNPRFHNVNLLGKGFMAMSNVSAFKGMVKYLIGNEWDPKL
jgi:hypothetical protein